MRTSLVIGTLAAAAMVSEAASATQLVVGDSRLVIDVEFFGRARIVTEDPDEPGRDVLTYGDPVHGTFRIFADDAPPAQDSRGETLDGKTYGTENAGRLPTGAAFVTSRWLSPVSNNPPRVFTHQVSPFPGSVPNDYVAIGDQIRFDTREPTKDWLLVSDQFRPNSTEGRGEALTIQIRTTHDVIQGFGLDQEFEVADLLENGGEFNQGFFRTQANGMVQFFEFVVDRIRVTPHVCKP